MARRNQLAQLLRADYPRVACLMRAQCGDGRFNQLFGRRLVGVANRQHDDVVPGFAQPHSVAVNAPARCTPSGYPLGSRRVLHSPLMFKSARESRFERAVPDHSRGGAVKFARSSCPFGASAWHRWQLLMGSSPTIPDGTRDRTVLSGGKCFVIAHERFAQELAGEESHDRGIPPGSANIRRLIARRRLADPP